ncbi:hypothetical protein [Pseudarthrobacter sp. NIBRBAC000502772]|nr:hypothetical protein [Pseudarthrobacter sp. NIBRBAC000502772]
MKAAAASSTLTRNGRRQPRTMNWFPEMAWEMATTPDGGTEVGAAVALS